MKHKTVIILSLLILSASTYSQIATEINQTDSQGRKQGRWIRKYPSQNIMYEGTFKDDQPVGEFRRYFENKTLQAILVYSTDGKEADATIYHPNGFISAQGKYVNQMKEGKWKFYSSTVNGYLISEEEYTGNKRNGQSAGYFENGIVAERINYIYDVRQGEWLQYYPNGRLFLKAFYKDGMLSGKMEVWSEKGLIELSGYYKENKRNGRWIVYKEDGSIKYELDYTDGITKDRQMEIDASELIEKLEKNSGKILDPEKTEEVIR